MSSSNDGFLKLYRKFFEHFLWTEKREYSKAEAWVWILKEARYQPGKNKKLISGKLIEWQRGQLPASYRFLKEAWSWGSTTKVKNFLSMLEKEHMIKTSKTQGQNVITVCKYSTYNTLEKDKKNSKKTEKRRGENEGKTQEAQNSKKGNKGNNKNKHTTRPRTKGVPIPDQLLVDGFEDKIQEYWEHLLQMFNKNPSIQMVEGKFRRLLELKNQGHNPVDVIQQTIDDGNKKFYQLKEDQFNDKASDQANRQTNKSRTDRFFDRGEELLNELPE